MKTNWTKLIQDAHAWAHASQPYELVLGPSASTHDLDITENKLGIQFPKEFRDLYKVHNGFGYSDQNGNEFGAFLPLKNLPEFIEKVRYFIEDLFPDEAQRFFLFFDWQDGGGAGYLLNRKGKLRRGLYDFHPEHVSESYREMGGFLFEPSDKNIRKFLSSR